MPELPHDLPHLYLRGNGKAERYTRKSGGSGRKVPQRDRAGHAETLRMALEEAFAAGKVRRQEQDAGIDAGTPGVYLHFEIPAGSEERVAFLENRGKHIELVAVRQPSS